MSTYNFNELEQKWRETWKKDQVYKVTELANKPKYYVLDMFPYPSGAGLHVGHPLGYIASDVFARFKRLQGYNVLHPMGFDAFGLPAEQYAIETGVHPAASTDKNIIRYKEQLNNIGFSYDWDREVKTCDPNYYKWTQWIFLQLYESWFNPDLQKAEPIASLIELFSTGIKDNGFSKPWQELTELEQQTVLTQHRLAYKAESYINWCEALGTVLANDEVVNGVSERGGHPVERKLMSQWFLRITAYADRLLEGLESVDFPESLKEMQKNWIGKSEGAEIQFELLMEGNTPSSETSAQTRDSQSDAENMLWTQLQNSEFGVKFRKQFPIDAFMCSFASTSPKICIEIDETVVNSERDEYLKQKGYKVLRFSAAEVQDDLNLVLKKIEIKIAEAKILEGLHQKEKASKQKISPEVESSITCFTTRPDTIFGVSFMVLAPEHPLVETITTEAQKLEVTNYVTYCKSRSELERKSETREVTGAFTGAYVKHPFAGKPIPVYIAEYVLMGYGTGAIMAVPCGDGRDYLFAKKFNLPIPNIFEGVDISAKAYEEKTGTIANSTCNWFSIDGLSILEAKTKCIQELEDLGCGTKKINYRMRDAGFSRQRYWGEPFPISYKNDLAFPDEFADLPISLPEVSSYKPAGDGKSPLSTIPDWVNLPNGNIRETDTMPGYAGSSWYYLRYMDPQNSEAFCDKQKSDYWQQVDLYIGGAEHAVGHLLYSRMWCKVLCDLGYISFDEPYKKLLNQGMIGGIVYYAYYDASAKKIYSHSLTPNTEGLLQFQVPNEYVGDDENLDEGEIERFCNEFTQFKAFEFVMDNGKFTFEKAITKMSKRLRNVVNPDEVIEKYGADSFRMYEMFLGPIDQDKPWNTKGIDGVSRFLKRFWAYCISEDGTVLFDSELASDNAQKVINRTLKKISEDIEKFAFNTCISSFMICLNELQDQKCKNAEVFQKFLIMLSPFAPHICQEIWQRSGQNGYILKLPILLLKKNI
jgi:leucyl-tRNA synthetase